MESGKMYMIVQYYVTGRRRVISRHNTLEEAQAHCRWSDTKRAGVWFEGYEEDRRSR